MSLFVIWCHITPSMRCTQGDWKRKSGHLARVDGGKRVTKPSTCGVEHAGYGPRMSATSTEVGAGGMEPAFSPRAARAPICGLPTSPLLWTRKRRRPEGQAGVSPSPSYFGETLGYLNF